MAAAAALIMALAFSASAEAASVIMGGAYVNAAGRTAQPGPGAAAGTAQPEISYVPAGLPSDFDVPEGAAVFLILEAGRQDTSGTLRMYLRQDAAGRADVWSLALETEARIGRNGLYKEKEGDSKTPVGLFKMNTPFGIGTAKEGFPSNYIRVDAGHYWNGDSESDRYNQLVSTGSYTAFRTSLSEHLADYAGYYEYCLDTGYNPEGTPYKGSAIFLHCIADTKPTHGCIAIPTEEMEKVMKAYREGQTWIAICDRDARQPA